MKIKLDVCRQCRLYPDWLFSSDEEKNAEPAAAEQELNSWILCQKLINYNLITELNFPDLVIRKDVVTNFVVQIIFNNETLV